MKQTEFKVDDASNTDLLQMLYLLRTAELYLKTRLTGSIETYKTFLGLVKLINNRIDRLDEHGNPKAQ